jgi:6-phosphogluconolactonase
MIETFADSASLADAAAAAVCDGLRHAIAVRGRASLIATGGRSPGPVYDRLCDAELDWARVVVSLSDDRFVGPAAPQSNERLVRERLLIGRAAAARFQPLWSDLPTPDACADLAEPAIAGLAPFDVVLLGMGEDGHVASLIPGSPVLAAGMDLAGGRFVLGVPAGTGSPPLARITLTLPALAGARMSLVLIAGATKHRVVEMEQGLPVHALLEHAKGRVRVLWTP